MAKNIKKASIQMRHKRIRKIVSGTQERPRLAVHFSGKHIYAQVIDDSVGRTIASANTTEAGLKVKQPRANAVTATTVGKVVFDRGGFIYHGKVKALADAAREGGLQF